MTDGKRRFWIGVAITLLGGTLFFAFLLLTKRHVVKTMFSRRRTVGALFAFGFALYANQLCYAQTVQITNAGTAFTGYDLAGLVLMCVMVAFVTFDEDDASSDDGG